LICVNTNRPSVLHSALEAASSRKPPQGIPWSLTIICAAIACATLI
jgi:hypothetical protein